MIYVVMAGEYDMYHLDSAWTSRDVAEQRAEAYGRKNGLWRSQVGDWRETVARLHKWRDDCCPQNGCYCYGDGATVIEIELDPADQPQVDSAR